jgi:uncharacterized membrane protein
MDKFNSVAKHIQKNLLAGLLTVLPLGITLFILKFIFTKADGILKPILSFIPWLPDNNTGISALTVFVLIYIVGLISSHVLGKRLMEFLFHKIPQRIPVISKLYSMFKGFVDTLSPGGNEDKIKGKIVKVKCSAFGPKSFLLGLLTNVVPCKDLDKSREVQDDDLYGIVFISSSPLPNSGQLIFVPLNDIYETLYDAEVTQEQYMSLIASMGTVTPNDLNFSPNKTNLAIQ